MTGESFHSVLVNLYRYGTGITGILKTDFHGLGLSPSSLWTLSLPVVGMVLCLGLGGSYGAWVSDGIGGGTQVFLRGTGLKKIPSGGL